ncbi:MAG: aspartate--ammonia ligase, partial [Fusobacteriaceae bacterium]
KCKQDAVIVHSLAKWKRMALCKYGFDSGKGLYTDMNAIRRDEDLSPIHSYYVDQWDWEKVLEKSERTTMKLKSTVNKIYSSLKATETYITEVYPELSKKLPENIEFVTSQELEKMYPEMTSKDREHAHAKKHGAIFISEIGKVLESGEKHDGRAPDYDDWDLNGDIIVYYEPLKIGLELSSMGIRVSEESLAKQLKLASAEDRKELDFHKKLLAGELPYTIGGGIGQSRLCLFFLDKLHIGEVQASLWTKEILEECEAKNIPLL